MSTPDSRHSGDHDATKAIHLTALEVQVVMCAMAGNFPEWLAPARPRALRELAKAAQAFDGTVRTAAWPSPGVVAVAELLRADYLSEYETSAPVEDWYPLAALVIDAYRTAEGLPPIAPPTAEEMYRRQRGGDAR